MRNDLRVIFRRQAAESRLAVPEKSVGTLPRLILGFFDRGGIRVPPASAPGGGGA